MTLASLFPIAPINIFNNVNNYLWSIIYLSFTFILFLFHLLSRDAYTTDD